MKTAEVADVVQPLFNECVVAGLEYKLAEAIANLPSREQQEITAQHLEAKRYDLDLGRDGWISVSVSEVPLVCVHYRDALNVGAERRLAELG
jgi:hypothetical protein